MGYWKTKVLPRIKKVFEIKNVSKKATAAAAAEACKSFDDSKETIDRELEEKKAELQPKVLGIYEACPSEIKVLVKERTEAGVEKNSAGVATFLEELAKIEFPGSKQISDALSKFGPSNVTAPIIFILEKVSTFLPAEETSGAAKDSGVTEREVVVVEEEKKAEEEASSAQIPVEEKKALPSEEAAPVAPEPVKPADVEEAAPKA